MDLERYKQPVAVVLAVASVLLLVLGLGGRGGNVLVPSLVPWLHWQFGLLWLALQVGYCVAFEARAGLVWVAVAAGLGALGLWVGLAFRPSTGAGLGGVDRVVTGAALCAGMALGVAVYRGRV